MKKIYIYKEHLISMSGVESVWAWECSHTSCVTMGYDVFYTTYWETALRSALHHIEWHKKVDSAKI